MQVDATKPAETVFSVICHIFEEIKNKDKASVVAEQKWWLCSYQYIVYTVLVKFHIVDEFMLSFCALVHLVVAVIIQYTHNMTSLEKQW